MLQPRLVKVEPLPQMKLRLSYETGEIKVFDVEPYIKGEWYGKLRALEYFRRVATDGYTVVWPDGQDICPDELYDLGKKIS